VDAWVGHQVGLELGDVDVKGTIESERSRQRRHNLGSQAVEISVSRALNVKVAAAYVVKGLVIETESAISVLKKGMCGQHVIVRLDHSSCYLRCRRDSERQLGLSSVIDGKALQ